MGARPTKPYESKVPHFSHFSFNDSHASSSFVEILNASGSRRQRIVSALVRDGIGRCRAICEHAEPR